MIHLLLAGIFFLSAAVQAAESVKLGLNYPSTGRYKQQGLAQARGALMAVDEINTSGGVLGRPLELLTANSASKPDKSVENVKELAAQGVSMLFGGSSSAVAIAAGKEAARHNLIYFGTLTYANETTGSEGHRHMFRETYNAHMAAKALAAYLNDSLQGKKLFYITADYSWGWSTEKSLREFTGTQDTAAHPGVTTTYPRPRDADFRSALQQARDSGADVLMLVQFGDDMAMALKLAHSMDLKDKMTIIVPNLTLGMAKSAGAGILENVIGAAPWTWKVPYQYDFAGGKKFVEDFVGRYQTYPSSSAASAYSIVYQFKDAAERSGSLDTEKLISALENHSYVHLKDQQTWRAFDHQNVQSVYVVKTRPRNDVLVSELREDFFDILLQLPGDEAALTEAEWQAVRKAAGKPLQLE
ncbi:MAG: branched-chain amino acid ABC transporter substrate-binding protein [Oceanospirillaceae bacterium]|nr:branched-chain amino acid ABC transporter substrate-binding protein [Thalassolituus sp.]MAS23761.1 branched-chain amino acid ABC transporter substrate-binding protein [Oceanospirillaceae bacterium]MAX99258.1 branched-chain amino acid ABC transporter substrate-binding protein [Oceanospirillaceae bacterium]MBL33354.1 branched-chain amino acid ABC transporter substrate-binding protein [Oceanospirillaceae bacterium]MBS51232.1 branched-chain amino acid ABC transporter substrate-binding protein [O